MAECYDPEIVFYTPHGEYRGRDAVILYLSQRYFKLLPDCIMTRGRMTYASSATSCGSPMISGLITPKKTSAGMG